MNASDKSSTDRKSIAKFFGMVVGMLLAVCVLMKGFEAVAPKTVAAERQRSQEVSIRLEEESLLPIREQIVIYNRIERELGDLPATDENAALIDSLKSVQRSIGLIVKLKIKHLTSGVLPPDLQRFLDSH